MEDITENDKEEIRKATDIVEIIGQYAQLKKTGQNYIGLCPFHSERSPSFTVNPEKQIYHCFGCGRGGDVSNFLIEYHSFSFPQSLKEATKMEKELTRIDISEIADKVMNFIKGKVGNNQELIKTILYECETRVEIERRLRVALDPLAM